VETEPVVSIENVTFSYDGHPVLENVNLKVWQGDFVSIVGPNGGGKTTLLKLMLGLLHPERGIIRIFGQRPQDARERIGYMPQHAYLDPQFPVRVIDVVLMGRLRGSRQPFGPYTKQDKEAAEEALERLQMWDRRKAYFSSLSGGQRQRALIARALTSGPDLLFLDEPTAGLDLTVENELHDLLKSFTEDLTVIVVSHDLGFVSSLVNKVVCVKRNVVMHPTSEISGEIINRIYGEPMKVVRHDVKNLGDFQKCLAP